MSQTSRLSRAINYISISIIIIINIIITIIISITIITRPKPYVGKICIVAIMIIVLFC